MDAVSYHLPSFEKNVNPRINSEGGRGRPTLEVETDYSVLSVKDYRDYTHT